MSDIPDLSADGVWIVRTTPTCYSKTRISKLCDLPARPYDFAQIMCSQDALCNFMMQYCKEYAANNNNWGPPISDLATRILHFLATNVGEEIKKQKCSRKIEIFDYAIS